MNGKNPNRCVVKCRIATGPQDSEYRNIGMISNSQFGTLEMNKIEDSPDEEVC